MKKILKLIKRSICYAYSIIGGLSIITGLWGYTVKDINAEVPWWQWGLIICVVFAILTLGFFLYLKQNGHSTYNTVINGKPVVIKTGDIFKEAGWKVIPCNERFDTEVNDHVIAHNTLNGKMIDNYIDDVESLNTTIEMAANDNSKFTPNMVKGRRVYPLGRLIPYNDFLLLSFSHFNDSDTAYIGIGEYEPLLIRMWSEMRRVYAAKPITLPLIGGGVTTIDGFPEKNYTELLKCMLCTLRRSKFQADQGITIVLTQDVINKIDMDTIKEEF